MTRAYKAGALDVAAAARMIGVQVDARQDVTIHLQDYLCSAAYYSVRM